MVKKRRPAPRIVKGKSGATYGTTQTPAGRAAQQRLRTATQNAAKFMKIDFGKPGQHAKPFELIPGAEAAAPTGLVVKGVGTAAKFVVKSATKQPPGKITPLRGSTQKTGTYGNQVRSGVMPSTGGGVPTFPGYPNTFAVMQSGKIDTRLLNVAGINKPNVAGGTRTYQAAVTGGPGSVKHQVKKKSFVKIKAGGPVMEFPGGTQTRYKKRSYQTVTTPTNLIQGQDPLTKKQGLDAFMATGAVAAPAASVPFWDQVGDFFNPFPTAEAVSPSIGIGVAKTMIQKFLSSNPKGKWSTFEKLVKEDGYKLKDLGVTKDDFLHAQKIHNMPGFSQQVKKPGGIDPHMTGPKMSDRKSAGIVGVSIGGALGTVAAAPHIAPWLEASDYVAPIDGGPAQIDKWGEYRKAQEEAGIISPETGAAAGAAAGITAPSELITDVDVPGAATLEERQTMQDTALEMLGFDAKGNHLLKSAGAAGPQPTVKYGLPSEIGQKDPNYTKITYQKWDGKKMVESSQWVKLGISGVTPERMTQMLNRQALIGQTNFVYDLVQKNIAKATENASGDKLLAAAQAAKAQYGSTIKLGGKEVKVSSIIGPLPQQYKQFLQRENKGGMEKYKAAIEFHRSTGALEQPVFDEAGNRIGGGIS